MIKALRDEVIVIKHKDNDRKDCLIITPDIKGFHKSYSHNEICEVVSVGLKSEFQELKKGDFIICQHNEGFRFRLNGQEYWRMRDKWVRAKINKEDVHKVTSVFEG